MAPTTTLNADGTKEEDVSLNETVRVMSSDPAVCLVRNCPGIRELGTQRRRGRVADVSVGYAS